jgi:hypothetical protein
MTEKETVPICTERFALERITHHNDQLADELYAILKLLAQLPSDKHVPITTATHHALRHSATITGFIHMAGVK